MCWAVFLWANLSAQSIDYARQIHPILVARCMPCHSGAKAQAGLSLTSRDDMLRRNVVVPGKSGESLLMLRVTGAKQPVMPMGGERLKDAEIELLRRWIDEGATVNITAGKAEGYSLALRPAKASSLDAVMSRYFQEHSVQPQPPVSDAVFIRRVYLDIWGLLPPPERQLRFVADPSPDKRARLVDELLGDRRNYAEHWITFWNDLLHNDEGVVYHGDRASITPWLVKALEDNKPYNEFAASLLAPFSEEDPSGFVEGVTWRGTVNASQTPPMQAAQNSAQVFLGINLKCNSCHDSFISHWKLKEAYALASFFTDEPLEIVRCDKATGQTAEPGFLYPQLGSIDAEASVEEKRAAAARFFTARENGLFARTIVNRIWRLLLGRGLVEPLDEMEGAAWSAEVLDFLAADFIQHGYDLRHLLKVLTTSQAYQLPTVPSRSLREPNYVFRGPYPRRLTAEEFADAVASMTGDWRVRVDNRPVPGIYGREWRFKANAMTRALGRPVRDAAVTERLTESTTLQALELTNGRMLNDWLSDGAKRLLDQPDPAPAPLFDSGLMRGAARVDIDLDVSGMREVRLLLVDIDSYDPARVKAGWQIDGLPVEAFPAALGREIVVDLSGRNISRLRGKVMIDPSSKESDIGPAIRAFIFDRPPNLRRLVPAEGQPPVAPPSRAKTGEALVDQLYLYALSRRPAAAERRTALALVAPSGRMEREGVQDFLWTLLLSPEFQFIR